MFSLGEMWGLDIVVHVTGLGVWGIYVTILVSEFCILREPVCASYFSFVFILSEPHYHL